MIMEMISIKKMMRNKYDFFLKLSSIIIKLKNPNPNPKDNPNPSLEISIRSHQKSAITTLI